MARMLTILLIAVVLEAIGVVFLSRGLKEIGGLEKVSLSAVAKIVGRVLLNRNVQLGVFFEALFFVGLLMLLAKAEVSVVWPLTALSFVATTIAAKFVLNEQISLIRWAGVLLITSGAALVSWSEKEKHPSAKPAETSIRSGTDRSN